MKFPEVDTAHFPAKAPAGDQVTGDMDALRQENVALLERVEQLQAEAGLMAELGRRLEAERTVLQAELAEARAQLMADTVSATNDTVAE